MSERCHILYQFAGQKKFQLFNGLSREHAAAWFQNMIAIWKAETPTIFDHGENAEYGQSLCCDKVFACWGIGDHDGTIEEEIEEGFGEEETVLVADHPDFDEAQYWRE